MMLLETSKTVQLEDKLDVNKQETRYRNTTPLHHALIERNHGILKLLLVILGSIMRGLGATECDGLNLLEFAVEKSDQRCLTTLLLHCHSKAIVFFMGGWETIIPKHASLVGNVELWDEWERGILDLTRKVLRPIHKLAEAGPQEIIESLLHSGMNVHELDEDNWTPADIAARYHHKELDELLRKDDPDRDLAIHK
ncbi:Serine threonine- phosphatase 6 regulatory ankyrin repeat subunit A [Fusarium agapanthi]|uniref:Serine threonine- phosphatase 6 regulatory ankyrin repeat subunit A n=1 Tax=Fusarium agapanthi TaxID=1803897 RepID=A0A9P5E2Q4_9HYPO|nr:Serine threonine- phosphatase 6 regulatory ankyrin repeat subunit A [Fusarium agapanthi]